MAKRTVKKIAFHAIARQLRETNRTQADIAADYNVSASTVSSINNAGTWSNYLANVKAAKPLRSAVKPVQPTKVQKAQRAGLNPQTRDDRFQAELDKVAAKYATKQELLEVIDTDISTATAVKDLYIEERDTRRTAWVALAISTVAFVLAVIALAN